MIFLIIRICLRIYSICHSYKIYLYNLLLSGFVFLICCSTIIIHIIWGINTYIELTLEFHHKNGPRLHLQISISFALALPAVTKRTIVTIQHLKSTCLAIWPHSVNWKIFFRTWYTLIASHRSHRQMWSIMAVPSGWMGGNVPTMSIRRSNGWHVGEFIISTRPRTCRGHLVLIITPVAAAAAITPFLWSVTVVTASEHAYYGQTVFNNLIKHPQWNRTIPNAILLIDRGRP